MRCGLLVGGGVLFLKSSIPGCVGNIWVKPNTENNWACA